MTRVVINQAFLNELNEIAEPLELYDEAGCLRGRVFPAQDNSAYELTEPSISEDEKRHPRQSNEKRFTTAEVLTSLENL